MGRVPHTWGTHLWAIPLGIFINLCHGHIGVEFILIFLQGKKRRKLGGVVNPTIRREPSPDLMLIHKPTAFHSPSLDSQIPYPRLLSQVRVHLLLAEWGHVMDLLVVALHDFPVLGDLLGIEELVGR